MLARGADAWKPLNRDRVVRAALRAYAAMTTSADTYAVRATSARSNAADPPRGQPGMGE